MKAAPGILARSVRDYVKDGGATLSASLSFFAVTAFVPLGLFLLTLFGYVLGENTEFFVFFTNMLLGLFPDITSGVRDELGDLIAYKGIGKASLLLYGLLSLQFYRAMHNAMEAVFKMHERRRSFLGSLALSLVVVTLLMALVFVSFSLTTVIANAEALKLYLPWLEVGLITRLTMQYLVPLLLVQFAAMFIYIILPKKKVRLACAFWGGLFTAVMLEVAKHVFTWYVGSVIKMGTLYGSLSAFMVFLLWAYYSASIFLIGGEIVHNLGERQWQRPRPRRR
jgi:membrane protein